MEKNYLKLPFKNIKGLYKTGMAKLRSRKSGYSVSVHRTTPEMAPVSRVLTRWVAAAVGAAIAIYILLTYLTTDPRVTQLDLIQIVLSILAAIGAVFIGVYAYRRQHLQEVGSVREDDIQFLSRYNAATEQLAHSKPAARLAGVYAMARLADDWPAQRQQCVDVLCAYLRMSPSGEQADEEVRSTILHVIIEHLRGVPETVSWTGLDFNFARAELRDLDMRDVVFRGQQVSFEGAEFIATAKFDGAKFHATTTSFKDASFSGAYTTFREANFSGNRTIFAFTRFGADRLEFDKAIFQSDMTQFYWAHFEGEYTSFNECLFQGSNVTFAHASFSSNGLAEKGYASTQFDNSVFRCRELHFDNATFTSATSFEPTTFDGCKATFNDIEVADKVTIRGLYKPKLMHDASILRNGLPYLGKIV